MHKLLDTALQATSSDLQPAFLSSTARLVKLCGSKFRKSARTALINPLREQAPMSGTAPLMGSMLMPDPLFLPVLNGRACILILASLVVIAALRWGRAICEELYRFVVLFRQFLSFNWNPLSHHLLLWTCDTSQRRRLSPYLPYEQ